MLARLQKMQNIYSDESSFEWWVFAANATGVAIVAYTFYQTRLSTDVEIAIQIASSGF
jgi:hypothetical protein